MDAREKEILRQAEKEYLREPEEKPGYFNVTVTRTYVLRCFGNRSTIEEAVGSVIDSGDADMVDEVITIEEGDAEDE